MSNRGPLSGWDIFTPDIGEAVRAMKMKISIEVAGVNELGRILGNRLAGNEKLRNVYPASKVERILPMLA